MKPTVLNGYGPRIVRINDYPVDFKPEQHQLVINHTDKPGIVGRTGQILGEFDINIASTTYVIETFNLE